MQDALFLTKARLSGKAENYQEWDDPVEAPSSDELLIQAINDLSTRVERLGEKEPAELAIDMAPVISLLQEVVEIQKKLVVKRKWKFDITQDKNGDLSTVRATEL